MSYRQKTALVVFFSMLLTFIMAFWQFPQLPVQSKFCLAKAFAEGVDETFPATADEGQQQDQHEQNEFHIIFSLRARL